MISVYIKKSDELAKTPTRANDSDAGYDLYSTLWYTVGAIINSIIFGNMALIIQNLNQNGFQNDLICFNT